MEKEMNLKEARALVEQKKGIIICCFHGTGKKTLISRYNDVLRDRSDRSIIYLSQRQFRIGTTGSSTDMNNDTIYSFVSCAKSLKDKGFIVLVDTLKGFQKCCDLVVIKEHFDYRSEANDESSDTTSKGWRPIMINRWLNYCKDHDLSYLMLESNEYLSSLLENGGDNA